MSHLNIAFDRYASIDTVMHYILVISLPEPQKMWQLRLQLRLKINNRLKNQTQNQARRFV